MKVKIDKEANALYIKFYLGEDTPKVNADSENPFIIPDFTEDGELYGIEIIGLEQVNLDSLNAVINESDASPI